MSFSKMFSILQRVEKEKIVLIKLGIFYIATGKDAVLLHNKLGLKCVCYKDNICKIGIPLESLERYLKQIEKLKYSYIVYDIDKIKTGQITSKEAHKYLEGHLGYIKYDDVYNLKKKLFYIE